MGAIKRLLDQRGSVTGSLTEVLVVVPIMLAVLGVILGFTVVSSKGLASNRSKFEVASEAQQEMDSLVTQIKRATRVSYMAPTLAGVPAGSTNYIVVTTKMPGHGSAPVTVYYTCLPAACVRIVGNWTQINTFMPADAATGSDNHAPYLHSPTTGNVNANLGVFRLYRDGLPVTTAGAEADRVELRFAVCIDSPRCDKGGFTKPITLRTTVTPRNVAEGV